MIRVGSRCRQCREVQAGRQAAARSPAEPSGGKRRASGESAEDSKADNLEEVIGVGMAVEYESGL